MYNNHYAQIGTTTYIVSDTVSKRRLRGDFLGYFNIHSDGQFDPKVTSIIEPVPSPGKTQLATIIPVTETEEVETLYVQSYQLFDDGNGLQCVMVSIQTDPTYSLLQHRVVSIGDAVGSWGGVFSLVAAFYYILFGTG